MILVLAAGVARADRVDTAAPATVVVADEDEAPAFGPPDSPVEVELFCTLGDHGCRASYEVLRQLSRRHPTRLRVVVRVIPLPGREGQLLAEAAIEAQRQGRFFPFLEALGRGAREAEGAAGRAGLDVAALRVALGERRHTRRVERDVARRDALGLVQTSALVWNGTPLVPAYRLDAFERAYDDAHVRAKAALAAGVPPDKLQAALGREADRERRRRDRGGGRTALDLAGRRLSVALEGAPIRGEGADATLVVFADFECPFCRRQTDVLRKLEAAFPGRIRVAFKHFPLPFHPNARLAAQAAACAHRQGQARFWALHDAFFRASQPLSRETIDRLAGEAGLDTARLWADVGSGACAARVQADIDEGRTIGIEATPTLLINGLKITGMRSLTELRAIVGEELSPGFLSDLTEP
jgi:protein-disulfide isomerase